VDAQAPAARAMPGGHGTATTLAAMAELSQADLGELVEEAVPPVDSDPQPPAAGPSSAGVGADRRLRALGRPGMSEHQYYEFLAADRPLTAAEQAEVRRFSTRARIIATSFINEYHWGGVKGSADQIMQRFHDAVPGELGHSPDHAPAAARASGLGDRRTVLR
jgi:hypothetical protein